MDLRTRRNPKGVGKKLRHAIRKMRRWGSGPEASMPSFDFEEVFVDDRTTGTRTRPQMDFVLRLEASQTGTCPPPSPSSKVNPPGAVLRFLGGERSSNSGGRKKRRGLSRHGRAISPRRATQGEHSSGRKKHWSLHRGREWRVVVPSHLKSTSNGRSIACVAPAMGTSRHPGVWAFLSPLACLPSLRLG